MKNKLLGVLAITSFLLGGDALCQDKAKQPAAPSADQPAADRPSDVWMRSKLKYGQNIYTSIARADLDAIAFDAKRLRALNWFEAIAHGKDDPYQEQLRIFKLANDKLIAEAEKKNLDGCTLAFMQMTFSCTACHQRLRESTAPKASAPAPSP
ncbi:MAG: hypothetical protein K8T91_23960 [Planctomycetes bacterium]|nr:hypothetical protein [Planctomycetota bacterium]